MIRQTAGQLPRAARAHPTAGGPGPSLDMADMEALYNRLADADEADDGRALAALAWELYGLLGSVATDLDAVRARLHQALTTAAA